jgi:hypothetical protein
MSDFTLPPSHERFLETNRHGKGGKAMTTETKLRDVDDIYRELVVRAEKGSCKTCQFCEPLSREAAEGLGASHICAIQGNYNPIAFSDQTLESEAYPGKCSEGTLLQVNDDGSEQEVAYCIAFKPRTKEICGDVLLRKHWDFLTALWKASDINTALRAEKKGRLTELLQVINHGMTEG